MTHYLKTWPQYFRRIESGEKTFEVRKNDRDFQKNDYLKLQEYDPIKDHFSGVEIECRVTYILNGGNFGIEPGFVVMAIERIN